VIDDMLGEMTEVRAAGNSWFVYSHALHVCRMAGCFSAAADLMDEEALPSHYALKLAAELLGSPPELIAASHGNMQAFLQLVSAFNDQAPKVHCLHSGRLVTPLCMWHLRLALCQRASAVELAFVIITCAGAVILGIWALSVPPPSSLNYTPPELLFETPVCTWASRGTVTGYEPVPSLYCQLQPPAPRELGMMVTDKARWHGVVDLETAGGLMPTTPSRVASLVMSADWMASLAPLPGWVSPLAVLVLSWGLHMAVRWFAPPQCARIADLMASLVMFMGWTASLATLAAWVSPLAALAGWSTSVPIEAMGSWATQLELAADWVAPLNVDWW